MANWKGRGDGMLRGLQLDLTPRSGTVPDFGEFKLVRVDTETQDQLWKLLMDTWHYLGAPKTRGPRIKYLIMLGKQPVGAMSYTSGSLRLKDRDSWIGWDDGERKELLRLCLNQNRFLLLPWIRIRNLASHILSRSLKQVRSDWMARYGYEPCLCETFVADPYRGTCYMAAGWSLVGRTGGYGRQGKNELVYHGNPKQIFMTVIDRDFLGRFARPADVEPDGGGWANA